VLTRDDVEAAHRRIAGLVRRTPVAVVAAGDLLPGTGLALKLEQLQHTGSFKARGALNRVLAAAERGDLGPAGVVRTVDDQAEASPAVIRLALD